MKKYLLYTLPLMVVGTLFGACSDDEELTDWHLTYYPVFEIQGEAFVESPIGSTYIDHGCKATLNGEDVTAQIKTTGLDAVDNQKPGLYPVVYSYTNADGITQSVSRTVAVCDPSITTDLSGEYITQSGTLRATKKGDVVFPNYKVSVEKKASGLFYVSDLLGGYYAQFKAPQVGEDAAMKGYVLLKSDGTITALSAHVDYWGDSYNAFSDSSYDADTGILRWTVNYADTDFIIILKK